VNPCHQSVVSFTASVFSSFFSAAAVVVAAAVVGVFVYR
jgi:hypothetical protein